MCKTVHECINSFVPGKEVPKQHAFANASHSSLDRPPSPQAEILQNRPEWFSNYADHRDAACCSRRSE